MSLPLLFMIHCGAMNQFKISDDRVILGCSAAGDIKGTVAF